ncbi:E3 ubiquitin-protein ligase RNF180 [Brachyistius frenatus]|uniref:E3 ubiquitin-protein ligase RNF180 n=1 Tax=Brachyistius frenatus TaxID=100188 RepID=UPI0037E82857
MSSHAGASGLNGSSRAGGSGTEDAGEENSNNETHTPCSKAVRPRLRTADPAGEGRSSSVEQLVRPALPGRKSHRKTCVADTRGRWREGNEDRGEERLSAELLGGKERRKQRHRKTERADTHGDGGQDRQGRGSTESLSSSNSDIQLNGILEVGEKSNNLQRGHTCPRPQGIGCTRNVTPNVNSQSPRPSIRTRSIPLSPRRLSSRPAAGDLHHYSFTSSREPDPFWVEVRTGAATGRSSQSGHTQIPSLTFSELGEEEEENEEDEENVEDGEEGGSGVMEVMSQTMTSAVLVPCVPVGERRMSKREKNRIKSLRRRQRRREKWRQSQQQESRQSSTGNPSSSSSSSSSSTSSSDDDEALSTRDREGYICAMTSKLQIVHKAQLQMSHREQKLNQTARTFFPKEYLSRKQNFQKANCAKWPLPSCRKLFRIFGGFQRQSSPIARRQFPHGGGYRLDTMDFDDDSRGWRFDMDMVIIYIYSVNWIIGFFIFCFLCYLFFPSF